MDHYIFLAIGLAVIVIGAMLLTDGAVALAERLGMPEFIVGLTVVAVGTSMPELSVSVMSAVKGNSDMAIGNVVGSNIFNIYVILGLCAMLSPIVFSQNQISRDIPLGMFTLGGEVHPDWDNRITRLEGAIMLATYISMIWVALRAEKRRRAESDYLAVTTDKPMPVWRLSAYIVVGLAALIFGGDMCVDNASQIARRLGVSESVIAITLVAGGTSLPELASSVAAVLKRRPSLALGNVLGSNIANILLILGTSSVITPLDLKGVALSDVWLSILGSFLLLASAVWIGRNRLTRVEGGVFVAIYVAYIATLLS